MGAWSVASPRSGTRRDAMLRSPMSASASIAANERKKSLASTISRSGCTAADVRSRLEALLKDLATAQPQKLFDIAQNRFGENEANGFDLDLVFDPELGCTEILAAVGIKIEMARPGHDLGVDAEAYASRGFETHGKIERAVLNLLEAPKGKLT